MNVVRRCVFDLNNATHFLNELSLWKNEIKGHKYDQKQNI